MKRTTVDRTVSLEGVAVFSGEKTTVSVAPGKEGIHFQTPEGRVRLGEGWVSAPRCSAIPLGSSQLLLTEHFLGAAVLWGLTDGEITLSGGEFPLLDGGGRMWFDLFEAGGRRTLDGDVSTLSPTKPLVAGKGASLVAWFPGQGLEATVLYHHPDPLLPLRMDHFDLSKTPHKSLLLDGRTFLLEEEAVALVESGVLPPQAREAEGSAIVVGKTAFDPIELTSHKALDLLGDLYLSGMMPRGKCLSVRGGHTLNRELLSAAMPLTTPE
ncbi:UDP-3-O-acyl-N-acetylglucosamine deacetylase [bacterium]|nr:UDP-3-O-acyl-N-acetylglucosamine deacetylase [bacterium]